MSLTRAREILAAALERPPAGRARIIAVDGPAGSGKSTLAGELRATIEVFQGFTPPVVCVDDFVGWTDIDADGTTWWRRWEHEVLEPLTTGRDLVWGRRDWWGDSDGDSLLPAPARAAWGPIGIVEGVSVARLAAADRIAYTVWMDAPRDVRLARGLDRDGGAEREHWQGWLALEEGFFAVDRTRERADRVIITA